MKTVTYKTGNGSRTARFSTHSVCPNGLVVFVGCGPSFWLAPECIVRID